MWDRETYILLVSDIKQYQTLHNVYKSFIFKMINIALIFCRFTFNSNWCWITVWNAQQYNVRTPSNSSCYVYFGRSKVFCDGNIVIQWNSVITNALIWWKLFKASNNHLTLQIRSVIMTSGTNLADP